MKSLPRQDVSAERARGAKARSETAPDDGSRRLPLASGDEAPSPNHPRRMERCLRPASPCRFSPTRSTPRHRPSQARLPLAPDRPSAKKSRKFKMIRAGSGRENPPPFAELAPSLKGAVLAKTCANSPTAISFRAMQVKRAADSMIAGALPRAAPARRAARTENRGFSALDGRGLCFGATI